MAGVTSARGPLDVNAQAVGSNEKISEKGGAAPFFARNSLCHYKMFTLVQKNVHIWKLFCQKVFTISSAYAIIVIVKKD